MSLYDFFKDPNNFVARGNILHMKAALDLKQTTAQHGIQLHLTEPEIDNQGYDFIAAVGYDQVYLQNKATLDDANVSSWKIHPLHLNVPLLERDLSPSIDGWPICGGEGAMGGVLLHLIDAEAAKADGRFFPFVRRVLSLPSVYIRVVMPTWCKRWSKLVCNNGRRGWCRPHLL
ncbi:hypothetical protein V6582_20645 (plasmid) [Agrobacterium vitis]|uniref:hypothetical protein n=1 Tax=Agrobacterium vitis TaxID=373 RepID=UPI0012E8AA1B|nr:hypothetical protein [Agrobacterium vitis]MVA27666.1 hypothetical protein [Agrobacterium vitis]